MKKVIYILMILCVFSIANAQEKLLDAILSISADGDTLVVAPGSGTLKAAIDNDVDPPAGRVYKLLAGYELYRCPEGPSAPGTRPIRIVGSDPTPLVQNSEFNNHPPIICGDGNTPGSFGLAGEVEIKNCALIEASPTGALGWCYFWANAAGSRLTLDNVLMERTRWVFVASNAVPQSRIFIKNCYFVNMIGQGCRRNGGVYDNVSNDTDTMWVENTTHIYAQGMMYKFRNYPVGKVVMNHNTFINIGSYVFETQGHQSNMSVTHNIFINCQTQPYRPFLDADETDLDGLPTGIINVRDLPETFPQLDRKILVDRNLVYWDPRLADIPDIANSIPINGFTNWVSQMITMNTRTQAMFDNDAQYPYLVEGTWYNKMPNFRWTQNLFTTVVDDLKSFSIATVDTNSVAVLPDWRLVFTNPETDYVISDWPIPVLLDYNDEDLLTAAMDGLPLGDLNWFPEAKAAWDANAHNSYATIEHCLQNGLTLPDYSNVGNTTKSIPSKFSVNQNYPNPFNPNTKISFTLPKAGNVVVKVYNLLGQEVATLLNEYRTADTHTVNFDGSNLASGIYVYSVQFGGNTISKKMVLLK